VSISAFIEHLKNKPCGGSKSYNKKPEEIETLGSSSVKKCFDILSAALSTAKEWKIIKEIPEATPPSVKYKKRAYWTPQEALSTIYSIDDPVLRLGVHIAYVLTLRPGEVVGIPIGAIQGSGIEIRQEIERMTDKALKATAKEDIIRVFPKKKGESGTQLVLLTPKTEGSVRRLYLNKFLSEDIAARLSQIEKDKQYYGDAYNDYGLLICLPNGDPVERTRMQRWFKDWQARNDTEIKIDMQGLRKSGAMYKLRLSDYDYQAVQLETGHSTPNVLMEHYNEVMVSEKSRLAEKFENDFYAGREVKAEIRASGIEELLQAVMADPEQLAALSKFMALQSVQV
jgi:integrase